MSPGAAASGEAKEITMGIFALIFNIIWFGAIFSIIGSVASKRKKNSWSRTPQTKAEERAEALRNASAAGSGTQTASGEKFDISRFQAKGRSYDSRVASYSDSNVSGLDKDLMGERGRKSIRELTGILGEDRKNDWMARQLREEARAKSRSSLDLGAAHDAGCDADELKRRHHFFEHSDGVDTGQPGRTIKR